MTDDELAPPMRTPYDDQREVWQALSDKAREGCYCAPLRWPCERHDAYEDGLIDMLCAMSTAGYLDDEGRFWEGAANTHLLTPVYRFDPPSLSARRTTEDQP